MLPFLYPNSVDVTEYFANCRSVRLDRGDLVADTYKFGDNVMLVRSGIVRVILAGRNGAERMLFYAEKGCILGETACFGDGRQGHVGVRVIAETECEIAQVRKSEFQKACIENPLLAWGVLSQFNSKLMNLISQIERASFHTATQQISLLLFDFWKNDQLRAQLPHYRSLLKVTHQELADATGKTRVSITNALHRLKQKGAIALHHGHIEVLDPDLLIEDEEALGPARQRMAENPPADRVASAA